jgi:hypothetical protein
MCEQQQRAYTIIILKPENFYSANQSKNARWFTVLLLLKIPKTKFCLTWHIENFSCIQSALFFVDLHLFNSSYGLHFSTKNSHTLDYKPGNFHSANQTKNCMKNHFRLTSRRLLFSCTLESDCWSSRPYSASCSPKSEFWCGLCR